MESSEEILDNKLVNEESSHVAAGSSGIFFPDGCGLVAIEGLVHIGKDYENVMDVDLDDAHEVLEDDGNSSEKDKNSEFKDDDYLPQKSEAIKVLFKGTFSENSKEIVESVNKLNKLCFGNNKKMYGSEDFSSPENQSCLNNSTLERPVENPNLIDTNDSLNGKAEETELSGNNLMKDDDDAQEMANNGRERYKALKLILLLALLTGSPRFPQSSLLGRS